jgi:Haem-dependent oxidative N-demethylase, alpha subunit-like
MTDTGTPAPYLPFDGGRFRLMMGLMPLAPADWIERDAAFAADLAAKRLLLEARRDEVFAALPEAAAPATELLTLLVEHLLHHHSPVFMREGGRLLNRATGERWDWARPALHPLDLAGRLVQEDLCLLAAEGESHRLVGATLCSPARWRLADKIGRPLLAIHEPVPGYAAKLGRPVDRFFAALAPERPVWRLNWGIADDPAPFQPEAGPALPGITAETAGELLWLRVERQTLRRLPASGAVVFTIRTHITRLDAAIASPGSAAELAAAIRDMPEETRCYKRIAPIAPALLAWLDARAR